jgi:hypothetical protein
MAPPLDHKSYSNKKRLDSPGLSQYASQSNIYETTRIIHPSIKQQYQTQAPAPSNDDPEVEHDFNKAYLKLVQKVYSEQGQNILITDSELAKL